MVYLVPLDLSLGEYLFVVHRAPAGFDDVLSNVDGSAHPRDGGLRAVWAYYRERLVCDGVDVDDAANKDGIFDELVK